MAASTQHDRAERFRALHVREGAFVIPNPWDVGSARLLAALGFEALATTSSGYANARGTRDGNLTLDQLLRHVRELSAATDLPVSADAENGFADAPGKAGSNLAAIAAAGAVGGSIEDFTGDETRPIYDFALAVERVHAAAEATHALDFPFTLTARAENLLHRRNDLDDTIRRLQAFAKAGADVLYAPGLTTLVQVRTVVQSVDKPVNVLGPLMKGVTVRELAEAGVKRVSIGGALARAATVAMLRAARELLASGSFAWTSDLAPSREIEELLGRWMDDPT